MARLEGARLLPWGGTVAGLQSAYHGHSSPSHQALQTERKQCPVQSHDKPPSCWENQILSPPERGRAELAVSVSHNGCVGVGPRIKNSSLRLFIYLIVSVRVASFTLNNPQTLL